MWIKLLLAAMFVLMLSAALLVQPSRQRSLLGARGQDRPKRVPLQQFGDDVLDASVRPDIVNGEDVRVVERRRGARFLLQPSQAVGTGGDGGRQHLDRDVTREPRITRTIDLAHGAAAQRRDDLIWAEAAAGREGQSRDTGELSCSKQRL